MRVICTQENLKAGLAVVGRIISPNNTLPILNNLLLKTENGQLKISSTNLEIGITTQVRCKIETDGEATVYAKTFSELVSNLPNTNITLNAENGEMKVETENYHTIIKTLPAEEFPQIPQIEERNQLSLPAQEFKGALDQVSFAASTNQTQPEISGVMLNVQNTELKVVATDRYRLAEKKVFLDKQAGFEQQVVLPQKTAQEISRVIGSQADSLQISLNPTQAGFIIGQTTVISRLVDGQYPDYGQIIPTQFNAQVTVQRKALVNALRAGGIFSQNSSSVSLVFSKESSNLVLTSESADLGKSKVEVQAEIEGESGNLLLNFHYLLDSLNAIDKERVVIKIIDDNSPAILLPEGDASYIYLVMPIKN